MVLNSPSCGTIQVGLGPIPSVHDIASFLVKYGYQGLFAALLAESLGLPLPGAIALLIAGAAVAMSGMHPALAFGLPISAMLCGDILLYLTGRYTGWALLGFLCRVSLNPESCILRSATTFYKRGRAALLFAKFLPGVNTMAPPLAGSMNMKPLQFLGLDIAGALIYTSSYETLGFLFSGLLERIIRGLEALSHTVQWIVLLGLLAYLGYRIWILMKHREYRLAPRVPVAEVAARLTRDPGGIVLADVRSHGYYDPGAVRVRGSIRLEPNNLDALADTLPKDKPIFLYCT